MNNEEKILSLLETLTTTVSTLVTKVDKLETEVNTVKESVIRIENEHGNKLDVLFDGYNALYDISKDIRKNVESLKADQDKHELNIKWLNSQRKA